MHAMRPPELSAAIRIPRPVDRALPLGTYEPLAAAAAAAQGTLAPAAGADHLSHVTPLHPDPFAVDNHGHGSSTLQSCSLSTHPVGMATATASASGKDEQAAPVATLTAAALQVLRLPEAAPSASAAAPAEVLARLPLSAVCSTAVDEQWLEVVFTAPADTKLSGPDAVVLPAPMRHGGTPAEEGGRGSRGEPQDPTRDDIASCSVDAGSLTSTSSAGAAAGDARGAAPAQGLLPLSQPRADEASNVGEGGGLPFRVLRVCCADSEGAAALRSAIVRQLATRREMLRRRSTLAPASAADIP